MNEKDKNPKERLELYLKKAEKLFSNLEKAKTGNKELDKFADYFYTMSFSYYNDAKHFYEKGEYINALASLEYAEGWADAGKHLGVLAPKKRKARKR